MLAAAIAGVFGISGAVSASTAVVLNSDDDTISVVDGGSYKETARVHIGRGPHLLILTPDGQALIIAMSGGNELVFIDRISGTEKQRIAVSDPYQLGFSPNAKWFV